jgi:hypothetical protein
VIVDLANGSVRALRQGDVYTSFARPRWGPDGHTIAVAMQRDNRWRIALIDTATVRGGAPPRFADPDDGANRFDPSWLGPNALVVTSDRSGTPNIERIDLPGGGGAPIAIALSRMVGAAIAPEPNHGDGSLWFLALQSLGYDVRRIPSPVAIAPLSASPLLDPRLAPVTVEPSVTVRAFRATPLPTPHGYGAGPRTTRWLPAGTIDAGGRAATFAIVNDDPVGRLTLLAQGALGNGDAWRGASLEAAWRRWRPLLRVSIFDATTSDGAVGLPRFAPDHTIDLRGGRVRLDYGHAFDVADLRVGLGASPAALDNRTVPNVARSLAFAELAGDARQGGDRWRSSETLVANLAAGSTGGGDAYRRLIATFGVHAGGSGLLPLDLSSSYGRLSSGAAPFEQFVVGGPTPTLVDPSLLTQRVVMGALPSGVATGDRVASFRISTMVAGLSPFYWGASTRVGAGRFATWHRVAGVELTMDQTPMSVLGLPGARLIAGIGHSLDDPFRHETRGYLTVSLRP